MFARSLTIDGNKAVSGDRDLTRKLPPDFEALFADADLDAVNAFADRCLGPLLSPNGSFTFTRDPVSAWLFNTSLNDSKFETETSQVQWAASQLGSIELLRFALFYSNREFYGFRIETREHDRMRVFASEKQGGHFCALPESFQFTQHWLSSLIIAQF